MKWFVLILVLAAIGTGVWWYQKDAKVEDVELMPATSKPDPSNATFVFEDGEVELQGGQAVTNLIPDSAISTETSLVGEPVYGDINGDKKNDAIVLLAQNSGGSGVFVYIGAYVSGNVAYKGSNAVFIGDRVSPQSVTIGNTGLITLTYLDRKEDEAMAASPTVQRTKTFIWKDGQLEER
jgi:hypothetical protein